MIFQRCQNVWSEGFKAQVNLYELSIKLQIFSKPLVLTSGNIRDQARGRLGQKSCPRGLNFAVNGTQVEVGVSLKKKLG